jgi:hypothetical protein
MGQEYFLAREVAGKFGIIFGAFQMPLPFL